MADGCQVSCVRTRRRVHHGALGPVVPHGDSHAPVAGFTVRLSPPAGASRLSTTAQLPHQFLCLSAAARIGGSPAHLCNRSSALRTPRELLDALDNSSHDAPSDLVLCFF
ncbi:hypothetical protein [Streptomyces melanosporofaciens]|uniref:hypothetical protein n=1 Tax=Streptomyces melanosporofaciens TaxID=67327 RepID=UPI00142F7B89|nr:hypothetical protein [Streptomyces melanosporofaciens]